MHADPTMTLERNATILDEMLRAHTLQRRIYRRFLGATALAFAGPASFIVKRATDFDGSGYPVGFVASLSISAAVLALFEARDARALTARIGTLSRELGR